MVGEDASGAFSQELAPASPLGRELVQTGMRKLGVTQECWTAEGSWAVPFARSPVGDGR